MTYPTPGAMKRKGMETLREALERLKHRGFKEALLARPGGMLARSGEGAVAPESLVVEEIVRFEGESDPGDEAVLFVLRSRDEKIRGTFITCYGTYTEPDSAAVIRRLDCARSPDETDSSCDRRTEEGRRGSLEDHREAPIGSLDKMAEERRGIAAARSGEEEPSTKP